MRDTAHDECEEFHVVLLDVRGRLLGRRLVSRGSPSQCPAAEFDALELDTIEADLRDLGRRLEATRHH
jgi:DNA repair protein RadC